MIYQNYEIMRDSYECDSCNILITSITNMVITNNLKTDHCSNHYGTCQNNTR